MVGKELSYFLIYLGTFMLAIMTIMVFIKWMREKKHRSKEPLSFLDWVLRLRGYMAIVAAIILIIAGIATCNK
jgi:purine-cytosine permease-like protein